MHKLSFYKSLSWLLVLNVFIKPVWIFGIDRVIQNRVGYEAYGSYFSILGLCITLSFLADAGLTNMINRELAVGRQINIKELLGIKFFCSVVYVLVVCIIAALIKSVNWHFLMPVLIIQILTSYLVFFRAIVTANQKFGSDAWLSILDKGLMILACGGLLYFSSVNVSVSLYLWLQVISLIAALALAFLMIIKFTHVYTVEKFRFNKIARQTLPFLILLLLMSAHNRFDAFMLHQLHPDGAYQSGVYASAYRLLDAGNVIGYLVASFLVPFAGRHLADIKVIGQVSAVLRQALLLLGLGALAFVLVYAAFIQKWMYPSLPNYDDNVLKLCIATLPAYYLTHIYGSLLTAGGLLKVFSIIVFIALVINIILNLIFIPEGAVGTCKAALISQAVCAAGCLLAVKRLMNVAIKPLLLVQSLVAGFLYWVLFYAGLKFEASPLLLLLIAAGLTALLMFAWWRRLQKTPIHF
jgi:O-antigen/teichoic acid export membrane protein